jgi:enterobactin synthetase component D / holo-[acyl-carrier protein] synthase
MLDRILPPAVAVSATRGDIPNVDLFPEEEVAIGRAVAGRQKEFATARACARRALAKLGVAPQPILPGAQGAPRWPAGIVGSITHCAGYRGCAVAHAADLIAIGVDAEPNEPLPEGLLSDIALPQELAWLQRLMLEAPEVRWDRMLFCMKEAVYKAWFPLAGRWLGFEDAMVSVDIVHGTFSARLLVRGPALAGNELTGFSGRWMVRDGIALAAIVVPAVDCSRTSGF